LKLLSSYSKNYYSQNGEDGILKYLLHRINRLESNNYYVEFGAWDGKHFSNTFALLKINPHSKAIYIEGDILKFQELLVTKEKFPNIVAINKYVDYKVGSSNSLENILANIKDIPMDFDVLSIDIDSFDLEVWSSLDSFSPKIVVIEINSSYPPGPIFMKSQGGPGGSFTATFDLAKNKGYSLVCHTGNLIFLRSDLVSISGIAEEFLIDSPDLYLKPKKFQIIKTFRGLLKTKLNTSLKK
jgi:hypothetical protein